MIEAYIAGIAAISNLVLFWLGWRLGARRSHLDQGLRAKIDLAIMAAVERSAEAMRYARSMRDLADELAKAHQAYYPLKQEFIEQAAKVAELNARWTTRLIETFELILSRIDNRSEPLQVQALAFLAGYGRHKASHKRDASWRVS